jgi:hypothetical protein
MHARNKLFEIERDKAPSDSNIMVLFRAIYKRHIYPEQLHLMFKHLVPVEEYDLRLKDELYEALLSASFSSSSSLSPFCRYLRPYHQAS